MTTPVHLRESSPSHNGSAGVGEDASGRGAIGGRGAGQCGVGERSSYYWWKKSEGEKKVERSSSYELTAEERQMIEAVKESHPEYRHRRIQGGVATAGSLFIGLGNLRAFKRAGTGRAIWAAGGADLLISDFSQH
jgi:hypothetical protein